MPGMGAKFLGRWVAREGGCLVIYCIMVVTTTASLHSKCNTFQGSFKENIRYE